MKFKEGDYILLPKVQYYNFNMSDKYSPSDNGMYELLEPDDAWRIIYALVEVREYKLNKLLI